MQDYQIEKVLALIERSGREVQLMAAVLLPGNGSAQCLFQSALGSLAEAREALRQELASLKVRRQYRIT